MANARMYALKVGATVKNEPKGQAARVLEELRADSTPRLAVDIDMAIATSDRPHKTRQDSLRVTLYYLLIFKKQGFVAASEQPEPTPVVEETGEVTDEELDSVDVDAEELAEVTE